VKGSVRAAQESEAIVYSVIIVPIEADAGRNVGGENALIQLSDDTGGKHFYASGAAQLDGLRLFDAPLRPVREFDENFRIVRERIDRGDARPRRTDLSRQGCAA
jgi:hypothetical protein